MLRAWLGLMLMLAIAACPARGDEPLPVPIPVPIEPPVRVPTVAEFADAFKASPSGGAYEVVLVHPCTGRPVKVCFRLPPGCPRRVVVSRDRIAFRYGLCNVVSLTFGRDGSVVVRG